MVPLPAPVAWNAPAPRFHIFLHSVPRADGRSATETLSSSSEFGPSKSQVLRPPLRLHLALASLLIIASMVTHLYQPVLSFPARRQHFSGEAQDKHGQRQQVRASQVSQRQQSRIVSTAGGRPEILTLP